MATASSEFNKSWVELNRAAVSAAAVISRRTSPDPTSGAIFHAQTVGTVLMESTYAAEEEGKRVSSTPPMPLVSLDDNKIGGAQSIGGDTNTWLQDIIHHGFNSKRTRGIITAPNEKLGRGTEAGVFFFSNLRRVQEPSQPNRG